MLDDNMKIFSQPKPLQKVISAIKMKIRSKKFDNRYITELTSSK